MPEISLYLDTSDDDLVLGWLFDASTELVPDLNYATQEYTVCKTMAEVMQFRPQARYFFALRDDFTALPLEVRHNSSSGRSFYYIMQRDGGPTLDVSLGGEFLKEGPELIGPGSLSHYPTYWHYVDNCNKPAPKPLVTLYRQLTYRIRKTFTRYKTSIRTYWIGPGAVARVRRGTRLVGFENENIDI